MAQVKVQVMYPQTDNSTFDIEYYTQKHLPMVGGLFGDLVKGLSIDKGISGPMPDSPKTYMVTANMLFDSAAEFSNAFAKHAPAILEDMPNYTNVEPVIQISEVIG
ncbi:MAG: EthD family reductase [Bacteroidia bacterium]